MEKYVAFVRQEYVRNAEIYNSHGKPDAIDNGWECAQLPLYLGIYIEDGYYEAMMAAAEDHSIVPEAILVEAVAWDCE